MSAQTELGIHFCLLNIDSCLTGLYKRQDQVLEVMKAGQNQQAITPPYAALSHCYELIALGTTESELFPRICRDAVQLGGMKMAWIGLVNSSGLMVPVASFGDELGCVAELAHSVYANHPDGPGPVGAALSWHQPAWCQDFMHDPVAAPWHERATLCGFASSALLPLCRNNQPVGVLALYSADLNAFDESLRGRLMDVAKNINFAVTGFANDALRRRVEDSLRRSEQSLREVQRIAGLGSYCLDIRTGIWESSDMFDRLLGIDATYERSFQGWEDLIHRDDRAMIDNYFRYEVEAQYKTFDKDYRITRYDDATVRWVHGMGKLELDAQGVPCKMLGTIQDITENKLAEAALRQREERYRTAFLRSPDGVLINRLADGLYLDVNDGFLRWLGWTRAEIIGKTSREINIWHLPTEQRKHMQTLQHDGSYENMEAAFVTKNGKVMVALISSHVMTIDGVPCILAVMRDITASKERQMQLERIAHFDALTQLPNRVLLADRLQQAMSQCQRRGQRVALAYLDLDGFKNINDQYGHEAGDQLLIGLAGVMKQALREGDTLARLGGDEFVAVLIDFANVQASVPMLTRLLAAAAQPVQVGHLTLQVSASLGVSFYPQEQDMDADQLLRQADHAMYQAKMSGKNRYHIFDSMQQSRMRVDYESLGRIRQALCESEFVLHYQPKINMRSGQIIGAEALIRWNHPERGLLTPKSFLPVIEDHPLASSLGEWVIDSALKQVELWRATGLDLAVSVNIGARQLRELDFADRLRQILSAHPQLDGSCLELEILEASTLDDVAQISRLIEDCAKLGVSFALDDFGTGYSSLTYLKRLPVTTLKIDQRFVRDMLDDQDDQIILQGVIGLAAALGRVVIAEGVQTRAHGTLLMRLGCELAQGNGIAPPMPAQELPRWVAAWRTTAQEWAEQTLTL